MAVGLQPAFTGVGVPGSSVPGGGGGASGPGGGMTPGPSAAPGGVVPLPSAAAAAMAGPDGDDEDGATSAQRELRILASAADQLFENTHHMSPEAVVSLLGALSDISHRTLAGMGLLAAAGGAAAAGGGGAGAAQSAVPGGVPIGGGGGGGLVPAAAGLSGMLSTGGAGGASAASLGSGASGVSAAAGGAAASGGGVLGTASGGAAGGTGLTGGGAAPLPLMVQPVVGPGGLLAPPGPGPVRLCALNRMVDTLLHNLWRVQVKRGRGGAARGCCAVRVAGRFSMQSRAQVLCPFTNGPCYVWPFLVLKPPSVHMQDLWGIFLAHVLEALGSGNAQVRWSGGRLRVRLCGHSGGLSPGASGHQAGSASLHHSAMPPPSGLPSTDMRTCPYHYRTTHVLLACAMTARTVLTLSLCALLPQNVNARARTA